MTPGELLAWNVRQAAQLVRELRPDAEIWVWSDMFDPMHNALEHYYAVNGSLAGSWKGLDKDVGIVNWHGELKGRNCKFFADLGLRQILSGYYDGDEDGSGIAALPPETQICIWADVAKFNSFSEDNDPHGERDFGAFTIEGVPEKIFWKIDYYADKSCTTGSEDPADPKQTFRVLTIMLASEY